MQTILITGANRGIGLALVQTFLQAGDHVIALPRTGQGLGTHLPAAGGAEPGNPAAGSDRR